MGNGSVRACIFCNQWEGQGRHHARQAFVRVVVVGVREQVTLVLLKGPGGVSWGQVTLVLLKGPDVGLWGRETLIFPKGPDVGLWGRETLVLLKGA